jgi:toxin ParE1/3/4
VKLTVRPGFSGCHEGLRSYRSRRGRLAQYLAHTYETWGFEQAETYFNQIETCCGALGGSPARSKGLSGLPDDVRVCRCQRHYIVWLNDDRPIIIGILHERMDFMWRLKDRL